MTRGYWRPTLGRGGSHSAGVWLGTAMGGLQLWQSAEVAEGWADVWGCHSGGAMQVWLQVGCPWAGSGGRAAQRHALQCRPALLWEGEELCGPWAGAKLLQAHLLGGTMQGRVSHPGEASRGGLGGACRNHSLTPECSALPLPHTRLLPQPLWACPFPSMPCA